MKTRVLFVDYSQDPFQPHPQHFFAPLDIGYCFSVLERAGCETSYLDLRIEPLKLEALIEKIKRISPDILLLKPGVSSVDFILRLSYALSDCIEHIYCYGPSATLCPGIFLFPGSPVKACLLGEIEHTVEELVSAVRASSAVRDIKGIAYFDEDDNAVRINSRELIQDLDSLPFPRHSIFINKKYMFRYPLKIYKRIRLAYILSSRGCPSKCIFCSVLRRSSYGEAYRARTPENVVGELELVSSLGFNTAYFLDDNFSYDKERTVRICQGILQKGLQKKISWIAQCSIASLDEDSVKIMKEAGCSTVCLGIESANDKVLKALGKGIRLNDIIRVSGILKKYNLLMVAFFIIGSPSETSSDILDSINLCRQIRPDMLQLHYFSVYPDSPISSGTMMPQMSAPYCYSASSNFSNVSEEKLQVLYKHFYKSHYFSVQSIRGYFRNQFLTSLINWKEFIPFYLKGIRYILS